MLRLLVCNPPRGADSVIVDALPCAGGKLLKNAPCSLADLYRTHHAKLQQQERPPLKRKAQNQLPDLRESALLALPGPPLCLTHCMVAASNQQPLVRAEPSHNICFPFSLLMY
jgi:hypothetical protein